MQGLMVQMKRILKKTGSCWINLGDTYSGSGKGTGTDPEKMKESWRFGLESNLQDIQAKSRYGIPERFYIQCIDDGWIARNHIFWYKENAMPTSVKDRLQNKWESIFFLVKAQRYYFNLDGIRERPKTESKPFNLRIREAKAGRGTLKLGDFGWTATEEEMATHDKNGVKINKQDETLGADGKPKPTYAGFNERWKYSQLEGEPNSQSNIKDRIAYARRVEGKDHDSCLNDPRGKNPGDGFFINPKPFPEAHFATFPEELPLKILKCACPPQVCTNCHKPREPMLKATPEYQKLLDSIRKNHKKRGGIEEGYSSYTNGGDKIYSQYKVTGWTKCDCNEAFEPGIVFDPFFGAGTVAVAAEQLALNWTGIEINEKYIAIAKKRLKPYMHERLL